MRIIFYILFSSFLLSSCDKVKFPIQEGGPGGPGGNQEKRKILLEDYTGHRCGTCPPAANAANSIANQYPGQVIVLSVHAGFLADPLGGTYSKDFRTQTGSTWFSTFGFVATPSGMINRIMYPSSQHNLSWGVWSSVADTMVSRAPEAYLTFTKSYNASTRQVSGSIKTKFYKNLSGLHRLVIVLMEDSIVGAQTDNTQNPPDVLNYVHRHVLRGAVNSTWGDTLFSTSVAQGDSITKTFNYTILNTYGNIPCNDAKCYLIAFIYNDDPLSPRYREIIQAEEIHVK
jgi:hypothetical protein